MRSEHLGTQDEVRATIGACSFCSFSDWLWQLELPGASNCDWKCQNAAWQSSFKFKKFRSHFVRSHCIGVCLTTECTSTKWSKWRLSAGSDFDIFGGAGFWNHSCWPFVGCWTETEEVSGWPATVHFLVPCLSGQNESWWIRVTRWESCTWRIWTWAWESWGCRVGCVCWCVCGRPWRGLRANWLGQNRERWQREAIKTIWEKGESFIVVLMKRNSELHCMYQTE